MGTFNRLFDRLSQLTGEKSRQKKSQMPKEIMMPNQINVSVKKKPTKDNNNEPKIKKGVGYTTGTGEAWNVSEFLASREARSN